MYLPAVFIYGDLHKVPERSMNNRKNAHGEVVIKYTCGTAFFILPFFMFAHGYAALFHLDPSGFSPPYSYAVMVGTVFWAVLGLYLLHLLLMPYFSKRIVYATVLSICFGTNFFHYATMYMGMSHIFSFALVSAILLVSARFNKNADRKSAIVCALLLGWLVLIRPTNILVVAFLPFFQNNSLGEVKQRLLYYKANIKHIIIAFPFFFLPIIPQMAYWKEMLGTWIAYSYEGEGFTHWWQPRLAAVLFDTQNGLLLYAPILLFALAGLWLGKGDKRTSATGSMLVFSIATYTFASWWVWWFGAAFGHRCYIEYFPILAFPMAYTYSYIAQRNSKPLLTTFSVVALVFIYYSTAMSFVFMRTGIWDGPDWRWNYAKWGDQVRSILFL